MNDYNKLVIQHAIYGSLHTVFGLVSIVLGSIEVDGINTIFPISWEEKFWVDCKSYAHERMVFEYSPELKWKIKIYCSSTQSKGIMFISDIVFTDLNFQWFVVAYFLITGLAHFFYISIYSNSYKKLIEENLCLRLRWIEYALSAGIMIGLIAFFIGIQNGAELLFLFNLQYIIISSGFYKRLPIPFVCTLVVSHLLLWMYLFLQFFFYNSSNLSEVPWFVYMIIIGEFVLYNLFFIMYTIERNMSALDISVYTIESGYNILSFVSKFLLGALMFPIIYYL